MGLKPDETSSPGDQEPIRFGVLVTPEQWRRIHRDSGLGPWDALARSEYVIGCALGEPLEALLERVRELAAAERERNRQIFQAERAEREAREAERKRRRPETVGTVSGPWNGEPAITVVA
jgi:hypothetical protein